MQGDWRGRREGDPVPHPPEGALATTRSSSVPNVIRYRTDERTNAPTARRAARNRLDPADANRTLAAREIAQDGDATATGARRWRTGAGWNWDRRSPAQPGHQRIASGRGVLTGNRRRRHRRRGGGRRRRGWGGRRQRRHRALRHHRPRGGGPGPGRRRRSRPRTAGARRRGVSGRRGGGGGGARRRGGSRRRR